MGKIRQFFRRKKAKRALDDRLNLNQVARGKRAVDDQHLGKGVTIPVKRQMEEKNLRVEDLEGMIRALNKFNHANEYLGYNQEINNRSLEAIRKRGIRGKKSRFLLTGINADEGVENTEPFQVRAKRKWKRFRNEGRPSLLELNETGREMWAMHAMKKAGVAKNDSKYPQIMFAVADLVELNQIEILAGRKYRDPAKSEKEQQLHGAEMTDAQERRFILQAQLLKTVGEKKGRNILEALHQMMVKY